MKKNCKLRIIIDTENFNKIKELATQSNLSISELCRQKLMGSPAPLNKTEFMLKAICKRLNIQLNNT